MADAIFTDGLTDPQLKISMGETAERIADRLAISREAQDEFAALSQQRAAAAKTGFQREIVSVNTPDGEIAADEHPRADTTRGKLAMLKPAFRADGTVTAANASSISDGAAALLLMRRSSAEQLGMTPLALIVGHASHAQAPAWFSTAPVGAMQRLFRQTGWRAESVDLYEINEAFAVVTLAAMKELQLPAEKVNIHGGACALGHPIGASGARILVSLIGALRRSGGRRGVASLCIGGGEATAMAIELA
jgi:acetyl-CoA C-acetyltransferase